MALPPGPPLPGALQLLAWLRRPTELMQYCRRKYGDTFTIRLPPMPIVFLCDPDSIKRVFTSRGDDMHAGEVNKILRALVGDNSVLLLDGAAHMRQRKLMLPSFHGERMRFYGRTMEAITEEDLAAWPEGEAFSMHPHMQHVTLEIILRTVFGIDDGARLSALRDQLKKVLRRGEYPISLVGMVYLSEHPEAAKRVPFKWLTRSIDETDALVYEQIAARRTETSGEERQDVLSMLMAARDEDGNPMTDAELRDELITALAAGHETTATSLCWAFERVLASPEVHDRLASEVDGAFGGGPIDVEHVQKLEYLDAVIKEALRLRPVLPICGRKLQQPVSLGGYDLPAGTAVAPCIYLAHRDPRSYPDPERFDPDRFLGVQPDPYRWLPFGGGIRRCLGAAFALYEMKIVMATILRHRRLELAQKAPARVRRRAITFWPEHGARITATARASAD